MLQSNIEVLLLVILFHFVVPQASASDNAFIEPGPGGVEGDYSQNNIYVVGSEVQVRWNTDFSELNLALCHDKTPDCMLPPQIDLLSQRKSYRWKVDLFEFDIEEKGNVFYFGIWAQDGTGRAFNSHYFNISHGDSPDPSPSSSSIASKSTTLPNTAAPSSTFNPSVPSASSTSNPRISSPTAPAASSSAPFNPGMSKGAKIGIGIGTAFGVLGFAVGALSLYFTRGGRMHRELAAPKDQYGRYALDDGHIYQEPAVDHYRNGGFRPSELGAQVEPQELAGGSPKCR